MISATRMLCQKYTDLTDAEISYLESYGALLPALANAEQADVFIDCRTVSGRSAIVVCEAKPQTVPSQLPQLHPGHTDPLAGRAGGGPLLPSGGSHLRGAGGLHAGGPPDRPVGGTPLL